MAHSKDYQDDKNSSPAQPVANDAPAQKTPEHTPPQPAPEQPYVFRDWASL